MSTPYTVVSFHTPDKLYSGHACQLVKTLNQFGITHRIEMLEPAGEWVRNCAMKPAFIQRKLAEIADRPVVWLDVDARVLRPPALFETIQSDFAGHYRAGVELLSNTLFFNVGARSRELAARWVEEQSRNPKEWDQKVLQRVIQRDGPAFGLDVHLLPPEYAAIDFMRVKTPTIIQTQASRTVRRQARQMRPARSRR